MFRVLNLLYISILCVSCNNISNDNQYSDNMPTDTIAYSYSTFKESSQNFIGNDDYIDTTYFQITYPIFAQQHLNDSIRKYILIDGENSPTEAAQAFIDGFDEFVGDSNIENIRSSWTKDINSRILVNTPIIVSLATQINEYSGGAHGQHYTFFSNYDIQKSKLIQLKDILQKDKLAQLTKLAEKYFRKQENLADEDSLSKDFFFEDGIFALNSNFGFTKNSLIIYYNEYEIKPYSEGPTILEIPYKDLGPILNVRGHKYIQSIL